MVENFGNYLKHERELRGVPLQEIADNTNIPIRFLQALEDNNLSELPGDVFVKGYIRSYAKSIGTNEDEILLAFDGSTSEARKEKNRQQSKKEKQAFSARRKKQWKALYGVLAFLLVTVVAGHLIRLSNEAPKPVDRSLVTTPDASKSKPSKPSPTFSDVTIAEKKETITQPTRSTMIAKSIPKSTPVPISKTTPLKKPKLVVSPPPEPSKPELKTNKKPKPVVSPPPEPSKPEPKTNKKPKPVVSPPPEPSKPEPKTNTEEDAVPGKPQKIMEPIRKDDIILPVQKPLSANVVHPLELTIQVKERSWFELLIDGTRVEDFILPKDTGKTFRAKTSFKITIGNRSGTQLSLNGESLVLPPGSTTEKNVVRSFLIQAN